MISLVLFACLIVVARSQNTGTCTIGLGTSYKVFKAYDLDNNGAVTRNEAIEIFKRSDSNADGVIAPHEFSTEWAFYQNDVMMPFFATCDEDNDDDCDFHEANRAFDNYFDRNGDNVITWQEWSGAWGNLANHFNSDKK